jgi:hypothetical protein
MGWWNVMVRLCLIRMHVQQRNIRQLQIGLTVLGAVVVVLGICLGLALAQGW